MVLNGGWIRRLVVIAVLAVGLTSLSTATAQATDPSEPATSILAVDDTPYEPPEISVGTPSWLEPLSVLAELPLWAQAAVLAAAVAAAIVVIPTVARWLWRLIARARATRGSR